MVMELQKDDRTVYFAQCAKCQMRAPQREGTYFLTKAEAEQHDKAHNLTIHGVAPKGFRR